MRPELLSPAGNWDCVRAAVANGADAVYFGLPGFNARIRADNFTEADLPELMAFLHLHGVRGYLTFNILVFTSELPEAERYLRMADAAGVDAIIVQDLGLVRLARQITPGLEIHASTQMTITSPEGVAFARSLGVERVVVARELSLRELERFNPETDGMLPIEVFVHGALCVAYSGQCLTSESLGQRSANRGECAQACRMPYEMLVDGEPCDLGDRRYLLSPQDLAAVDEIPRLVEIGVRSFKIEGRLKSPEYVAAVTQVYRRAIDRALAGKGAPATSEDRYQLEMTFSRGLFPGWMHGVNHQELVHARFGTKRGPYIGEIVRVGREEVELGSIGNLKPGDGVVFDTGGNTDHEQGGRVYEIAGRCLRFQHGKIDFGRLSKGHRVWKTSDPHLERELRKTFAGTIEPPALPLTLRVSGSFGGLLEVEAIGGGATVTVASSIELLPARSRSLNRTVLEEHLGRLGGSGWSLASLESTVPDGLFLPLSELNELRRRMVAALEERTRQTDGRPQASSKGVATPPGRRADEGIGDLSPGTQGRLTEGDRDATLPRLTVLCRTDDQIGAALEAGIDELYLDFEDVRRYADAVARVRDSRRARVFLATPRIQKAGEQGFFKLIERAEPDGVLIRNLGGLSWFEGSGLQRVGDFSLNVANPLTATVLMERGLDRLTVSYDLNSEQVVSLLEEADPGWFELTLHQHMPMFHMEHCVYAAFLSKGKTFLDCGRPCETHRIHLKDRVGVAHPVHVDVGCRNTVYHARSQSGATYLKVFLDRGLRTFRIELLDENHADSLQLIRGYRDLLEGRLDSKALIRELKVADQLGVTAGTLLALR
ncbi:MAG: DUF3656 domain-containing protein [Opitutaceae bacterium]